MLDRGWSNGVEGLIIVKAPAYNIAHISFFNYEENVIALSDHLKNESQKLSLKLISQDRKIDQLKEESL